MNTTANLEIERLENLPLEILEYHILPTLSLTEIKTLASLSSYIHKALTPRFWLQKIHRDFTYYTQPTRDPYKTYLQLYQNQDTVNVYLVPRRSANLLYTYGSSSVLSPKPEYLLKKSNYENFTTTLHKLKDLNIPINNVIIITYYNYMNAYKLNMIPTRFSLNYTEYIEFSNYQTTGILIIYSPTDINLETKTPEYNHIEFNVLKDIFYAYDKWKRKYESEIPNVDNYTQEIYNFLCKYLLQIAFNLINKYNANLGVMREKAKIFGLPEFY